MWDYSEKVMDHFMNPRNVGEIKEPDAVGEVGNMSCGDALRLMLKVSDDGVIEDVKYQTFGCASAIASSSALSEMILGKSLDEAAKVTNQDLAEFLEGLPEEKMHCSVMGMEAFQAAVADYRSRRGEAAEEDPRERLASMPAGNIVCRCFGVTDTLIERVVRENKLTTVEDVIHYTKAGGGCRGCHDEIRTIVERVRSERDSIFPAPKGPRLMTTLQKIRAIEETIEREIRPSLQMDGGDIELVDVDGDRVVVALRGHCAGCTSAEFTLKLFVEEKLREFVHAGLVVEEVKTV